MHDLKSSVWELIGPGTNEYNSLYRCVCGKIKYVNKYQVANGRSLCCGCLTRNKNGVKHGLGKTPEYAIWNAMKSRCADTTNPDYGGRGITVCARWNAPDSFPNFFADMGARPHKKLSIHRINNALGYWCGKAECPECGPLERKGNCEWATTKTQLDQRRNTVWVAHEGDIQSRQWWAKKLKISQGTLKYQLDLGKSMAEIIEMVNQGNYKAPKPPKQKPSKKKPSQPPPPPTIGSRVIEMSLKMISNDTEYNEAVDLVTIAIPDTTLSKVELMCLQRLCQEISRYDAAAPTVMEGGAS